ncbi:unnamed protein product [Rhizophagus irregularis]|nr:unnamed protein product [Rhizophagus irregularis]
MSIVYEAIKALSFTPKEKTDLRAFFVNNPDKRKEVELFIFECTDDEVVSCLRNVLKPAPLQVTENQDLNGFIKALKDTDFNTKISDLLELADNTKFFGLKNQPSKLFIRNCYKDLFQTVLKPEIRNLRISSSLGIGKPFFGYYLLYDLLKKDRTIVYELHTMKSSVILFKEGKGFYLNEIFNHKIIRNYLHKENTWYIIDGKKPYNASVAKTILISSPMKSHYHDFDKGDSVNIRIMPVWTWEEINYCRQKLFDNLDENMVSELYIKWGGIPRYILKEALNSSILRKLIQVVDTCDEKIFQYIGGSNIREDVSHILVHMWTNFPEDNNVLRDEESTVDEGEVKYIAEEYYTETIIKFASDYVGNIIYERHKYSIIRRLQAEVEACQKQNFVTPKDDISWRLPRCIKDHVKQYVLGIDLSSGDFGNLIRTSYTATIEEGVSTIGEPSASNVASSDSIIPAKRPSSGNQSKGSKGKKRAS